MPPTGTPLQAGGTVTFTATLNFTLASADSGQIVIVIQDQNNQNLRAGGPQPAALVNRGTGTATLADSVVVPASGITSVRVIFPLVPQGATRTDILVSISYPVM
jgi:hypothetical protein